MYIKYNIDQDILGVYICIYHYVYICIFVYFIYMIYIRCLTVRYRTGMRTDEHKGAFHFFVLYAPIVW